jgi:CheY-like chemotaxis protein
VSSNLEQNKPIFELKLLIVDDSIENGQLFEIFLSDAGADVDLAFGGKEAIEKFQTKNYDMVLLDIEMPDLSGFQTIVEMKKICPNTPIIALTAHATDLDKAGTLAAGFKDHITKPISPEDLFSAISRNSVM